MVTAPYTTITASARGADAYAELPPAVTPRKLTGLTVNGPRGASVVVYLGFVSPTARIDQNPNGFSNTADYPNPRPIPAGQRVIAVWPGYGTRASECSATFVVSD